MMRNRFLVTVLVSAAVLAAAFGVPEFVHAQEDITGIGAVGETVKLSSQDPRVIAANIINATLGLLGIILVSILVYAGFLYMTSGGVPEKVDTAKKWIRNAIIGLILILSSWAIARFVIERLLEATTEPGGAITTGAGSGFGGGFTGGGASTAFQVKTISPLGSIPIRNVIVKIVFSRPVDEATATAIAVLKNGGTTIGGTIQVSGNLVTFTPPDDCPAPNQTIKCFDADTEYTVQVGTSLRSSTGQSIVCGGFAPDCSAVFTTGNLVDTKDPIVAITEPLDGQSVPADSIVLLRAHAEDDSGISHVTFTDSGDAVDSDGPTTIPSPTVFDAEVGWSTAGIALQSERTLRATAFDLNGNTAESSPVGVIVRPPACFNGVQDGDESGVDCGGTPNTPGFCGACSGGSCTTNNQCSSGVCQAGSCVDQPIVTDMSPQDGQPGTFVTLSGVNFGTTGQVVFLGGAGSADDRIAPIPDACVQAGMDTWSAKQVVVAVPEGAGTGPVQITNGASNLSDRTDDQVGPGIADFVVNDSAYPGLCGLDPSSGFNGNQFKAIGSSFGASPDSMSFGPSLLTSFSSWTDAEVTANVPISEAGARPVLVHVGTASSNPVNFSVLSQATAGPPTILAVTPGEGPRGEYLTLSGTNFGYTKGTVRFTSGTSQEDALADTNFPAACAENSWTPSSVIVKVPSQFLNNAQIQAGAYTIRLTRSDNVASNAVGFTVTTGDANPGICSIVPNVGPVGTKVSLFGERFGSQAETITFHDNKAALSAAWGSAEIKTSVPAGAVTGPVTVSVGSQMSNAALFQVANCNASPDICSPNQVCCGDGTCTSDPQLCEKTLLSSMFAWQSSTGLVPISPRVVEECAPNLTPQPVPSPSPWDARQGGDQVCVTASMAVRFTTHLDPTTVTPSNFRVQKCTGLGTDPCAETTDVQLGPGSPYLQPASQDQDLVLLEAAGGLEQGTSYLVEITTGVRGAGTAGANMEERLSCGQGIGYCYRFTTRDSPEPCAIGAVSVSPHPYEMNDTGETAKYLASPISLNDKCTVLMCSAYDWTWEHGDSNADGRATFETPFKTDPLTGNISCKQVGVGLMETGDVPVNMNATALPDNVKGTGHLFVRFVPPRVVSYAPNCQTACTNALISATFNTTVDAASLPGNVVVRPCANENCVLTELGPALAIPANMITLTSVPKSADTKVRFLRIEPVIPGPGNTKILLLAPGKYYRVLLKGGTDQGIRGMNGVPMAGLNDPDGFVWTFRTKLGEDAFCEAETVDVSPLEKYETEVGARQLFIATPYGKPDECSLTGQALVQTSGAAWSSSDPAVADYVDGGTVDTGANLPPRCSASCRWTGSQAEFGKVAVCGNGIIETTDSVYCQGGQTPFGDACTVLPGGAEAGEQCDPGVPSNVGLCDPNSCLWKPIPQVPNGTCGNGSIEQGEACDFGRLCDGAAPTSTTPDGTDCTATQAEQACLANGGTCAPRNERGCTPFCRHAGSAAGQSTCGNGDIADGEDCDDGNVSSLDGCSSQCLHTGSSPSVASVCGNAILEPGEACEKANVQDPTPPGCDAKKCLNLGTPTCDNDPNTPDANCCGNASVENGEDCDDGNKLSSDGCSSACLFEGSSVSYFQPSFCSDGVKGTGEQCEAGTPGGDGLVDAVQLAEIIGNADPDENGLMSSTLSATVDNKEGDATYGLQCGFTDEQSCASGFGLSDAGCCYLRPTLQSSFPTGSGACRNTLVKAAFNTPMNAQSVFSNVQIAKQDLGPNCPSGTELVYDDMTSRRDGILGWLGRVWDRIVSAVTGDEARAAIWCKGSVTGVWRPAHATGTSDFVFTLDSALEAQTTYRVKFFGDNSTAPDPLADNQDPQNKHGIKSVKGVVAPFDSSGTSGPLTYSFTTGDDICAVNVIQVTDESNEHPLLFVANGEEHPFTAEAVSIQNGVSVPIAPVAEYAWSWTPWTTSDIDVVTVVNPSPNQTNATVKADNKNGNAFVVAMIEVTEDTVQTPSTEGKVVQGTAPVTVSLCENPWPNLDAYPIAPFRDKQPTGSGQDSSLAGTIFENGPFFNFSTMYCRDAGDTGTADDLPKLEINPVPPTSVDAAEGILRQYLFTYGDDRPELKKDGIGIRVAANPLHLSPEDWYAWRGFGGDPKPVEIDGYRAIQDGTTTYIAAANTENPGERIYSNVYLISHNPDAALMTVGIYDQMVESLAFNINLTNGVANVCEKGNNPNIEPAPVYYDIDGPVRCSTDWECLKRLGDDFHCGSHKLKLARDTARVADFQSMSVAVEASKGETGFYPRLTAGTFVRTFSTSRWPSWDEEFASALKIEPPKDPVNQFNTCGRCSESQTLCGTDDDCPQGQVCAGYSMDQGVFFPSTSTEPLTCFDTEKRVYICPRIGVSPSRTYHYRSVNNGQRYELAAEFEVPEPSDPNAEWWYPTLQKEINRCANEETFGFLCDVDKDCRPCANPKDDVGCPVAQYPVTNGACRPVGGRFVYQDVCTNQPFGVSGTCGDGVIGSACSGGSNNGNACVADTDCPGGSCTEAEACELGQTTLADCTTPDNQPGLKLQVCNECKGFVDEVGVSACNASTLCGNGRIDKVCSGGVRNTLGCLSDADCTGDPNQNIVNGSCISGGESCDDGLLNGTYGHCNLQCNGYAAYCGDAQISPGELCDLGGQNGQYCGQGCNVSQSCSLDCKGKAPYCGDGITTSPEMCDGETQTTVLGICTAGTAQGEPCANDAECGANGVCAASPDPLASCLGITQNKCATALKQCVTQNYASANHNPANFTVCQEDSDCAGEPGGKTSCRSARDFVSSCNSNVQCSLGSISGECLSFPTEHVRTCNTGGNDACAFEAWSACKVVGFCGDGIMQSPAEECDDGSANGDTKSCTSSCKRNVCGDGKPYIGVEECDAGAQNGTITCQADYGSTCASCSTQCKFLSTSGGYCGDETKNGPEQCDGNQVLETNQALIESCQNQSPVPVSCQYFNSLCENPPCRQTTESGITCKSIGFDFAVNGSNPDVIPLTDDVDKNVTTSKCAALNGMKYYDYLAMYHCLGLRCKHPNQTVTESMLQASAAGQTGERYLYTALPELPQEQQNWAVSYNQPLPSVGDFWQCVREEGASHGIGVSVADTPELIECGISCSFAGCGKCSDEIGSGVIEGTLIDAVYNKPVPFARISLFYKGVLVKQDSSDADGHFTMDGLNQRNDCALYRLVIDSYEDNPCTNVNTGGTSCGGGQFPPWIFQYDIDEGARGGYWPLETQTFGMENYEAVVIPKQDGRIYMFPRPGTGEAYFSILWGVDWSANDSIWGGHSNHLILPSGYTKANNTNELLNSTTCSYANRPAANNQCVRDVTWLPTMKGHADLSVLPYSQQICLHKAGDLVQGYGGGLAQFNGCPVEGGAACLQNNPGDYNKCQKGVIFSDCVGGSQDSQLCNSPDANAECIAGGGTCAEVPCQRTFWDTCDFYKDGPLTTYFRYSAFSGSVDPIRMMWGYWWKSVHTQSNNSANDLKTHLKNKKYTAVLSTDTQLVMLDAGDLTENCDGSCKFWHVGDISPTTGQITVHNKLRKGDENGDGLARSPGDVTEGVAAYQYHFQGGYFGPTAYYCMKDGNNPPNNSVLYYVCDNNSQGEVDKCQQKFGNAATCKQPTYAQWSRANF